MICFSTGRFTTTQGAAISENSLCASVFFFCPCYLFLAFNGYKSKCFIRSLEWHWYVLFVSGFQ